MTAHNASTRIVAERLASHARIEKVHYPSLPSHPDHALAHASMQGFGGVLSFEVQGGASAAAKVIDATEHIVRAASLGGVSSLLTWPAGVTHVGLNDDERRDSGVAGGLLRLAVGIESVETIWKDLDQALKRAY